MDYLHEYLAAVDVIWQCLSPCCSDVCIYSQANYKMCSWLPGSGQVLLGFCLKMPQDGFLWTSWKMALLGDCCGGCSSFGASGSSFHWPAATCLFLCCSAARRPCSRAGHGATLPAVLAPSPSSDESVPPPVNCVPQVAWGLMLFLSSTGTSTPGHPGPGAHLLHSRFP